MKNKFTFIFMGARADQIAYEMAVYFWDGGFEDIFEQSFLEPRGMSVDNIEFKDLYNAIINTMQHIDVKTDNIKTDDTTMNNTFTFTFTGDKAEQFAEELAVYFWDGGLDEFFEQNFLEDRGLDLDDVEMKDLYNVLINTDGHLNRR